MLTTPLCKSLQIDVPIIQAPIGSASSPELAAAVSNAGGLGMLAGSWLDPEGLRHTIRRTRQLTHRPFGVNLVLEWPQEERLEIILDEGVRIVSLFWGDPAPYVERVHTHGGLVLHSIGDTAEARRAVAAGVDVVVAQGWEAGGHVRGSTALSVLLPSVCDAIDPVPVIASGGIADGRGVAAALVLGAQAAWLGTRFIVTSEALAHPVYQQHILRADDISTHHGIVFDVGWPQAAHRVIVNDTVRTSVLIGDGEARPGEGETVAVRVNGEAITRYSDVIPLKGMTGDLTELAMYAGQSAALLRDIQPAGTVVRRLIAEAEAAIEKVVSLTKGVRPSG